MKGTAYRRQVIAGVRALGAQDVALSHGGKHPRLTFFFNGREHRVTLASSPSDTDAVKIKLGDVRRRLGILTERWTEEKEMTTTTETIMEPAVNLSEPIEAPATEERPTTAARGRVGYYASNRCLEFTFAKEIGACLPQAANLSVAAMGTDTWVIRSTGDGHSRLRNKGGRNMVVVSGKIAAPDLAYFGGLPAEYVAVDDHVMVRLLEPPPLREVAAAEPEQEPPPVPTPRIMPAPAILEIPTDAECRAALDAMRRIYATTPFRLVEMPDGKLRLQAIIE
jgi:hypothetical protein